MTLRILSVAQAELDDAVIWYDGFSLELGSAFLLEARRVFRLIEQHPHAWHPMEMGLRRCRMSRFPYGVIYGPNDGPLIIAVAHLHRAPFYWRDRLSGDGP